MVVTAQIEEKKRWVPLLESAVKKLNLPEEYAEEAASLIEIARGPKCKFLCFSMTSRVLASIFLWLVVRKHGFPIHGALYTIAEVCGANPVYSFHVWMKIKKSLVEYPEFKWIANLHPTRRCFIATKPRLMQKNIENSFN